MPWRQAQAFSLQLLLLQHSIWNQLRGIPFRYVALCCHGSFNEVAYCDQCAWALQEGF